MGASFPVQKPVNDRFLEDTTLFFKEVNALITFYVFSKLALLKVIVTVNFAKRNSNLEKNRLQKNIFSQKTVDLESYDLK